MKTGHCLGYDDSIQWFPGGSAFDAFVRFTHMLETMHLMLS